MSVGIEAKRARRLHGHLVGAAEEIEVVDVARAKINLQRLEDALHRHVEHLRFGAVDVEEVLGRGWR